MTQTSETLAKLAKFVREHSDPVELAVIHTKDGDIWDPLDHPRNKLGHFVKKGFGVFLFGQNKKASYKGPGASAAKIDLDLEPGDVAYHSPAGNVAVRHANKSYTWYTTSGNVSDFNAGTPPANTLEKHIGKGVYKKIAEAPPAIEVPAESEQEAESSLQPVKVGETVTKAQIPFLPVGTVLVNDTGGTVTKDAHGHWFLTYNGKTSDIGPTLSPPKPLVVKALGEVTGAPEEKPSGLSKKQSAQKVPVTGSLKVGDIVYKSPNSDTQWEVAGVGPSPYEKNKTAVSLKKVGTKSSGTGNAAYHPEGLYVAANTESSEKSPETGTPTSQKTPKTLAELAEIAQQEQEGKASSYQPKSMSPDSVSTATLLGVDPDSKVGKMVAKQAQAAKIADIKNTPSTVMLKSLNNLLDNWKGAEIQKDLNKKTAAGTPIPESEWGPLNQQQDDYITALKKVITNKGFDPDALYAEKFGSPAAKDQSGEYTIPAGDFSAQVATDLPVGTSVTMVTADGHKVGTWEKTTAGWYSTALGSSGKLVANHEMALDHMGSDSSMQVHLPESGTKKKSGPSVKPAPVPVEGKKNKLTAANPDDAPDPDGTYTEIEGIPLSELVSQQWGFTHPVSKEAFPLEQGDQVLQHKLTPESFAVLGADGTKKFQVNKNGKKYKWSPHIPKSNFKVIATAEETSANFNPTADALPEANDFIDGDTFTHPVSGLSVKIGSDEVLMQHNFTPHSYLVMGKDGSMRFKIDVKGKKQKAGTNLKPSNYFEVLDGSDLTKHQPLPEPTDYTHSDDYQLASADEIAAILDAASPNDYVISPWSGGGKLVKLSDGTWKEEGTNNPPWQPSQLSSSILEANPTPKDVKSDSGVPLELEAMKAWATKAPAGTKLETPDEQWTSVKQSDGSWSITTPKTGTVTAQPDLMVWTFKALVSSAMKKSVQAQEPPKKKTNKHGVPIYGSKDEFDTWLGGLPEGSQLEVTGTVSPVSPVPAFTKTASGWSIVLGSGSLSPIPDLADLLVNGWGDDSKDTIRLKKAPVKVPSAESPKSPETKVEGLAQKVAAKKAAAKKTATKKGPVLEPNVSFDSKTEAFSYVKKQVYYDVAKALGDDSWSPSLYYQSSPLQHLGYNADYVEPFAQPQVLIALQQVEANIEAAKKVPDLTASEKAGLTKLKAKFIHMQKMAVVSQQLKAGEVPELLEPFKWGNKKTWAFDVTHAEIRINAEIQKAQFKESVKGLGFDPYNGTHEQYLDYLQGAGHPWAIYLDHGKAQNVALHYLGDPTHHLPDWKLKTYTNEAKAAHLQKQASDALIQKNGEPFTPAFQTKGTQFPTDPPVEISPEQWTAIQYALSTDFTSEIDPADAQMDWNYLFGPMAEFIPPGAQAALISVASNFEFTSTQKSVVASYLLKSGIWNEDAFTYDSPDGKFALTSGMSVYTKPSFPGFYWFVPKGFEGGAVTRYASELGRFTRVHLTSSSLDSLQLAYAAPSKITAKDAQKAGLTFTPSQWESLEGLEGTVPPRELSGAELVKLATILKTHPVKPSQLSAKAQSLILKSPNDVDLIVFKDQQGHYRVDESSMTSTNEAWKALIQDSTLEVDAFAKVADLDVEKLVSEEITPTEALKGWSDTDLQLAYSVATGHYPSAYYHHDDLQLALADALGDWHSNYQAQEAKPSSLDVNPPVVGLQGTLKPLPNLNLGGGRPKRYYADLDGNQYMAKPDNKEKFRPDTEHAASEIARMFGFRVPPSAVREIDGEYSHLQELLPATGDFSGFGPDDLTDDQLMEALSSHALDWAVSNHDTHAGNFLFDPGGRVIKIDLGQAWKALGKDKLQVGWELPGNFGGVWYDKVYKQIQSGKMDKGRLDKVSLAVLRKARQISTRYDDEYRKHLDFAFKNRTYYPPGVDREAFIQQAMDRKAAVFSDFMGFYKDLYQKGGYDFPFTEESFETPKTSTDAHLRLNPEFVDEVKKNKVYGKSLFFASGQIEDGHMFVYTTQGTKGSTTLHGDLKLRSVADAQVMSWISDQKPTSGSSVSAAPSPQNSLPDTQNHLSALTAYVKTVATHQGDGNYTESTVEKAKLSAKTVSQQLESLQTTLTQDPLFVAEGELSSQNGPKLPKFQSGHQQQAWMEWAQSYQQDFQKVTSAMEQKTAPPWLDISAPYTAPPGVDVSGKPKPVEKITKGSVEFTKYSDWNFIGSNGPITQAEYEALQTGEGWKTTAIDQPEESEVVQVSPQKSYVVKSVSFSTPKTTSADATGTATDAGRQDFGFSGSFKISSKDYPGVTVHYTPHEATSYGQNLTNAGRLQLEVTNWDGSENHLDSAMALVRDMGVDLTEADEDSLERQYWDHLAAIVQDRWTNPSHTVGGKSLKNKKFYEVAQQVGALSSGLSDQERVNAIKSAFTQAWGAEMVNNADYLPHFSSYRDHVSEADEPEGSTTSGRPYWLRPDFDVEEFEKSSGGLLPSRNDNSLTYITSGAFTSNEGKALFVGRFGDSSYGTLDSPTADRNKGSSEFSYFRQGITQSGSGIYIEPHVMARTSNYAFREDNFGSAKAKKSSAPFGLADIYDWGSNKNGSGSNEILVKHSLSLFDDIAVVQEPSSSSRAALLKHFKDLGIIEIRGIPIEERIVSDSSAAKKTMKKVWEIAKASQKLSQENREAEVGTVRTWDGRDYIKRSNGQWSPVKAV